MGCGKHQGHATRIKKVEFHPQFRVLRASTEDMAAIRAFKEPLKLHHPEAIEYLTIPQDLSLEEWLYLVDILLHVQMSCSLHEGRGSEASVLP